MVVIVRNPDVEVEAPRAHLEEHPVVELLRELVCDDPAGGAFYQVQFGDRPLDLARGALATCGIEDPTADELEQYMHLLAAGVYNGSLYGSASTSIVYPKRWLTPGLRIGVRSAWLPRNEDAIELYLRGQMPQCTIDARTGAPLTPATSRGMLWCPPVDRVDGELTTSLHHWEDGSSAIDPPPMFLDPNAFRKR